MDIVRKGVLSTLLKRTRGDVTQAMRQHRLKWKLADFQERPGQEGDESPEVPNAMAFDRLDYPTPLW